MTVGSFGKPTTTAVPLGRRRLAAVAYASFVAAVTIAPEHQDQLRNPIRTVFAYRERHMW